MIPRALHNETANIAVIELGRVTLYFSYRACIAASGPDGSYRNERYVRYSATTTKHARNMGVADWQAIPEAEFDCFVSKQLVIAESA